MPITKTLLELRTRLSQQAGIDTDAAGNTIPRHPTSWVNQVINDSFRSLRAFVVARHYNLYRLSTTTAALPTTPVEAGEFYAVIPWPATACDVLGVDVTSDQTQGWRPLEPVEFEERRSFEISPVYMWGQLTPYAFCALSEGTVSGSTFTAGTIAVFPVPRGGNYKVWYLPEHVDITNDAHLFLFANEDWAQWLLWEATRRIAARDNDSMARLAEAARQLNPLAADTVAYRIAQNAPRHVRAGPQTMTRAWNY